MVVNDAQKLVDASPDSYFFIGFDHAALSDFCAVSSFHIGECLIDLVDDLLTNLFKIAIELINCEIYFFFLGLYQRILLLLELTLSLEELLFTLPTRFLVNLILAVAFREVEVAVVQNR